MMPDSDDTQITPREFDARIQEIRRAVDLARESSGESTKVELREYVEAMFAEGQRATEMAERERAKAADAITVERRQTEATAEREREKSAQALAMQLAQQVQQGDRALKDHIEQQFAQLQIMLDSTRREIEIRSEEQQKAITKAETSTDNRFHSVNEIRRQMGELITSHQESLTSLTSKLMPREVAEAKLEDLGNKVASNTQRLDRMSGEGDGQRVASRDARGRAEFTTTTLISLGLAMVAVVGLILALLNLATN